MDTETIAERGIERQPQRDPKAVALGRRIETARGIVPRRTLAAEIGVHENTVGKWERGETVPSALQLVDIALLLGKAVVELLDDGAPRTTVSAGARGALLEMPRPQGCAVESGPMMFVPVFDPNLVPPREVIDIAQELDRGAFIVGMHCMSTQEVRGDLAIAHEHLAVVRAHGAGAEPEIADRDYVLLDRSDTSVAVEGLYLVSINNLIAIKLLARRPGRIVVRSPNAGFGEFEVDADASGAEFQVIGRCRWASGPLR